MTMSEMENDNSLPVEIINLLRLLSHDLVRAQQDANSTINPATILTKAAPLVSARYQIILLEPSGRLIDTGWDFPDSSLAL